VGEKGGGAILTCASREHGTSSTPEKRKLRASDGNQEREGILFRRRPVEEQWKENKQANLHGKNLAGDFWPVSNTPNLTQSLPVNLVPRRSFC
jgi:hypothetical protein